MKMFNQLFLICVTLAAAIACQGKNNPPTPPSLKTPPEQPSCQPPPTPGSSCEQECREDECDYEEAGEEAMIQLIEIDDDAEEQASTSIEEISPMPLEEPVEAAAQIPEEPVLVEAPAEHMTQETPSEETPLAGDSSSSNGQTAAQQEEKD